MVERLAFWAFILCLLLVVSLILIVVLDQSSKQTKWMDACLQEQKADGYNHERAARRCIMRWIELEKASQ